MDISNNNQMKATKGSNLDDDVVVDRLKSMKIFK